VERAAADRGVKTIHVAGDYEYQVATRAEEPVVRDILARVSTGGQIRLSFPREPDAFGAHFGALSEEFILARHREKDGRGGEYVGVCERVVRDVFVNRERQRLPYLAALRVLPQFRHRLVAIRGGFEAVRELLGSERDLPWSLTSIMSDNAPARRLLGANLRGMPRYEPVGELSTFVLTAQGGVEPDRATDIDLPRIAELLLKQGAETQFASAWTHEALREAIAAGWLRAQDFLVRRRNGVIQACVALWDPSRYRQLVVAGYAPWLARTRPLVNGCAALLRLPRLPPPGARLHAAYLSHLAVDDAAPEDLLALVAAARAEGRRRGLAVLLLGWASDHALAAWLRQLRRQREYRSQLYVVRWPGGPAPALDPHLRLAPELALL
jgi:hypothetical protein